METQTKRSSSIASWGSALWVIALILVFVGAFVAIIGFFIAVGGYNSSLLTLYIGLGVLALSIPAFLWSCVLSGFAHVVRAAEAYYQEKGLSSPETR